MGGITIDEKFETVRGVLVVTRGHGRFLRLRHVFESSTSIPQVLTDAICEMLDDESPSFADLESLAIDLAESQAVVVEQLKCHAGKYVDRMLAVAVAWPQVSGLANGEQLCELPLSSPDRLAERSGVTIIDRFPERDLSVGGSGGPLEPLPLWLMLADRDAKVSLQSRWAVLLNRESVVYHLPPSDGLDVDLPAIQRWNLDIPDELCRALAETSQQRGSQLSDLCDPLMNQLVDLTAKVSMPSEVFILNALTCDHELQLQLNGLVQQQLPNSVVSQISKTGCSNEFLPSVVTALLGLMHIDQMPANVPWITGASSQRTLGRITPGRPSNWRQFIRTMADCQPAAMKLKDAI